MNETPIAELLEIVKKDRRSPQRRYPDQALYALDDERVKEAVSVRLGRGSTLIGIRSLGYNFTTGLNQICFEFRSAGSIDVAPDGVLVLLNDASRVVAVVEPFNPIQPNRLFPPFVPSVEHGAQPFALARPSESRDLAVGQAEVLARDVQRQEFARRYMIGAGGGVFGDGGIFGGGRLCETDEDTTCEASTSVLTGGVGADGRFEHRIAIDYVADD